MKKNRKTRLIFACHKRWDSDITFIFDQWQNLLICLNVKDENQTWMVLTIWTLANFVFYQSALFLLFKRQVLDRSKSVLNFTALWTVLPIFSIIFDTCFIKPPWFWSPSVDHFSHLQLWTQRFNIHYQINKGKRYKK